MIVKSQYPREVKEMWILENRANILNKLNELFAQASKSINYDGRKRANTPYKANADSPR